MCACGCSGRESCSELAEEGWRAFLCAVREEEIREEEIREEEIREESRRVAALAESERDEPDAVEDDGNIPMFPIGAPLSHSDPNGGESPPHQYRRVSYLID
jgi:NAD(P)-dependent dehydrogenase (short-subunit alcohol dehydrogenase family)